MCSVELIITSMNDKERNRLISNFTTPLFTIADISKATGMEYSAIRTWVNRQHVELLATDRPGRGGIGNRVRYSLRDAMQFLLFSELNKQGLGPQRFEKDEAHYMLSIIQGYLQDLARGITDLDERDRYLYIYTSNDGSLGCSSTSDPSLRHELNMSRRAGGPIIGSVWTVIDAIEFAYSLLAFFNKNAGK